MSDFVVRKGLLIEKVPTHENGDLVVFQIHLLRAQNSGLFYVREGRMEETRGD